MSSAQLREVFGSLKWAAAIRSGERAQNMVCRPISCASAGMDLDTSALSHQHHSPSSPASRPSLGLTGSLTSSRALCAACLVLSLPVRRICSSNNELFNSSDDSARRLINDKYSISNN